MDISTEFFMVCEHPDYWKYSICHLPVTWNGNLFFHKTKFVQFRYFKRGIQVLTKKKKDTTGVSPLAAFMLSAAMRVGPGNIIGVTGAISLGGPGAMFWMWISALLGMASSFVEATLAQIFKEKDGDEYVGGLPYYGQKLAGNKKRCRNCLSYFVYHLCNA